MTPPAIIDAYKNFFDYVSTETISVPLPKIKKVNYVVDETKMDLIDRLHHLLNTSHLNKVQ